MTESEPDRQYGAGMAVRRDVLGDDHVDRATTGATAFTAPFQDLVTRLVWGEAWSRPQLDRRVRSCITLAILTALRCEDEIALHVRGAVRNGLAPDEIAEVLLHTAVYAGVPSANIAFRVAQRTLAELGHDAAMPATNDIPQGQEGEP